MRTLVLGELLTADQIEQARQIIAAVDTQTDSSMGKTVERIQAEVIDPALAEITRKGGQEFDPRYLAYMVCFAISQAQATAASDIPNVQFKHHGVQGPMTHMGKRGHIFTWECDTGGGWHCAVEDLEGHGCTAAVHFADEDMAITAARSLIAQHVTDGLYTVVNQKPGTPPVVN